MKLGGEVWASLTFTQVCVVKCEQEDVVPQQEISDTRFMYSFWGVDILSNVLVAVRQPQADNNWLPGCTDDRVMYSDYATPPFKNPTQQHG